MANDKSEIILSKRVNSAHSFNELGILIDGVFCGKFIMMSREIYLKYTGMPKKIICKYKKNPFVNPGYNPGNLERHNLSRSASGVIP